MSTKQEVPRRPRRGGGIRDGRTELGGAAETPPAPRAAPEAPSGSPAAAAPSQAASASRSARSVADAAPATPGNRRAKGKVRVAGDVPKDLAQRFGDRADEHRFSKAIALAGAIELLEQLDDDAYEKLLRKHR